jgi:hypothetical protein
MILADSSTLPLLLFPRKQVEESIPVSARPTTCPRPVSEKSLYRECCEDNRSGGDKDEEDFDDGCVTDSSPALELELVLATVGTASIDKRITKSVAARYVTIRLKHRTSIPSIPSTRKPLDLSTTFFSRALQVGSGTKFDSEAAIIIALSSSISGEDAGKVGNASVLGA